MEPASTYDVVIIGAGCSGVAVAHHLNKLSANFGNPLSCALIDSPENTGLGLAYRVSSPSALLNVRVRNMVIDGDEPMLFAEFLKERNGEDEDSFVPRSKFGEFLKNLLHRLDKL